MKLMTCVSNADCINITMDFCFASSSYFIFYIHITYLHASLQSYYKLLLVAICLHIFVGLVPLCVYENYSNFM